MRLTFLLNRSKPKRLQKMHADAENKSASANVSWREYGTESAVTAVEEEAEEGVEAGILMIGVGLEIQDHHHRDGGELLRPRGGRRIRTFHLAAKGVRMCGGDALRLLGGQTQAVMRSQDHLRRSTTGVDLRASHAAGQDPPQRSRHVVKGGGSLRAFQGALPAEHTPRPQLKDRAHVRPDETAHEGSAPSLPHAHPLQDALKSAVALPPLPPLVQGHLPLAMARHAEMGDLQPTATPRMEDARKPRLSGRAREGRRAVFPGIAHLRDSASVIVLLSATSQVGCDADVLQQRQLAAAIPLLWRHRNPHQRARPENGAEAMLRRWVTALEIHTLTFSKPIPSLTIPYL